MKKFDVGEIVYVTPGFPYQDWNGLSATVVEVNAGDGKRYVRVKSFIPMPDGQGGKMSEALFNPEDVQRENRPWLKKHLRQILKHKCKHLTDENRCAIYHDILKTPYWKLAPAFGAGCCSPGNSERRRLLARSHDRAVRDAQGAHAHDAQP